MKSNYVQILLHVINRYNLTVQYPELAVYQVQATSGKLSEGMAKAILVQLQSIIDHAIDFPNYLHRDPTEQQLYAKGKYDIEIGSLVNDPLIRIGLRYQDKPRHVLSVGATGAGKSTLIRRIIIEVEKANNHIHKRTSQIIFDRKGDYGDLTQYIPKDKLLRWNVYDSHFKIGLQPPAGVASTIWIQIITALISVRANPNLIASAMCLANLFSFLVAVLNIPPSNTVLFPDFRLIYETALSSPPWLWATKPEYAQTLTQILQILAQCPYFQTFSGIDMERDVISQGKTCLIEIPTLYPSWIRLFIIDLIIAQILYGRIHRRQKCDTTEVIIYLDEADQDLNLASTDHSFLDSYSILAQLLRMGREFGIMIVVGAGILGQMSPYISSSFQNTFVFNMGEGNQLYYARQLLHLPPNAELMLPALPPGQVLLQQNQQAWHHAMHCQIDCVAPDRSRSMPTYDPIPFYIPSKHLHELPHVVEALEKHKNSSTKTWLEQKKIQNPTKLSPNVRLLLDLASLSPYVPVIHLNSNLKPASIITARKELENLKLARFDEPQFSSRKLLLVELTDQGWLYLNKQSPVQKGKGGSIHRHIVSFIQKVGQKKGYQTHIEWIVPNTNHPVDCAWLLNSGKAEVFEVISTYDKNIPSHLANCLTSDQISSITIVVTQKRMIPSLKKQLEEHCFFTFDSEKIRFETVDTFLKELWP
ncbi:MAG TPA: DUF87 domain-containing protein [Anaerohalosphaeraceae bacterium]|nr:DUF87 domain-containing protein [Anaerohalosphaeraceae bacterium]